MLTYLTQNTHLKKSFAMQSTCHRSKCKAEVSDPDDVFNYGESSRFNIDVLLHGTFLIGKRIVNS